MLTQADLDSLRLDFDESLPDEATVVRTPMVDDGQGGQIEGEPVEYGPYPARLSPLRNPYAEQTLADRLAGEIGWMLTLPWNTAVELGDDIQFTFLETMETRHLEIIGIMDPRSFNMATRVACVEVR